MVGGDAAILEKVRPVLEQVVKEDLAAAIATGLGDNGVNGVILPLEQEAGVTVRPAEWVNRTDHT